MKTRTCLLAAALFCLVSSFGCNRTRPAAPVERAVEEFHQGPPLTEADGKQFAAQLEKAAHEGNARAFQDLFDWKALFERSTAGLDPSIGKEVLKGAEQADAAGSFARQITEAVSKGGSYRLVRVHDVDGHRRVLFRLLQPQGVNYHDLILVRGADNQIRAVDFLVYLSGELMSRTFHRLFLTLAVSSSRGLLGKLMGTDRELVENASTMTAMNQAIRDGKPADALAKFKTLPPRLKKEKAFLLIRLMAAQAVGEEAYQEAMDDIAREHPGDPCMDLIRIDALLLKKKFDDARAAVDRLDQALGGDPYLDVFRCNISLESGQLEQAREAAQRAVKALPDQQLPHWCLVTVSLRQKDHEETARLLTDLEDRFKLQMDNLENNKDYQDFVRSPAYKKWLNRKKEG
jgi:hypothetical protein